VMGRRLLPRGRRARKTTGLPEEAETESRRSAQAAYDRGDFGSAYREFLARWYSRHDLDDVVSAGRSLERAQQWRANIALWEEVARRISAELAHQDSVDSTSGRLFERLQLPPEYWQDPRGRGAPAEYYRNDVDKQRHRRAWALHWAAEHASAAQRHELASRLHRSAAFAWAASRWGDVGTGEACKPADCSAPPAPGTAKPKRTPGRGAANRDAHSAGNGTTESEAAANGLPEGEKWEHAASAFFYSILEGIETNLRDRKDTIAETYEIHDDASLELRGFTRGPHGIPMWLCQRSHDTDRLVRCYRKWAEVRGRASGSLGDTIREALTNACVSLGAIERALARAGRRADAVAIHKTRQALMRERDRWHPINLWRRVTLVFFGDGVRPWVPITWTAALWLLLFPALFAFAPGHLVQHSTISQHSADGVAWYDAWLFGIANALTISVYDLRTNGSWGALAQVLDAFLTYILFGAVLWSIFRSFEE
jgi:hypothetical protein